MAPGSLNARRLRHRGYTEKAYVLIIQGLYNTLNAMAIRLSFHNSHAQVVGHNPTHHVQVVFHGVGIHLCPSAESAGILHGCILYFFYPLIKPIKHICGVYAS
jgi:hypothetical protein